MNWTQEEDDYLKARWPHITGTPLSKEMAVKFKRTFSRNSIIGRAKRLGLKKGKVISTREKTKPKPVPIIKPLLDKSRIKRSSLRAKTTKVPKNFTVRTKIGDRHVHLSGDQLVKDPSELNIYRGTRTQAENLIEKWSGPGLYMERINS